MTQSRPFVAASPTAAIVALLLLAMLGGCARDSRDWSAAQKSDTPEAYDGFLAQHPDSEFAPRAKERAAQLVEERDWGAATLADSPEAYQKFVGQHPDGKWTQEARIRIENFNVMAAAAPEAPPASAPAPAGTPAAPAAAAQAASPRPSATVAVAPPRPAAPPAAPSSAAPPASGSAAAGHRVQLGAFSSVEKAEAEWTRARGRFAALQALEPRITAAQTAAGRLFRLQAGVADETEAKALCATLKAAGQACLHVPPP